MKLTLTREQVPLARETAAWLRNPDANYYLHACESLPGFCEWDHSGRRPGGRQPGDHDRWASALEAAITEAEHPMQVITLAKQGDADERAFWREAFTLDYAQPSSWCGADRARYSVQAADVALAGYREAFCTGMPSDQKGAK